MITLEFIVTSITSAHSKIIQPNVYFDVVDFLNVIF